MHQLHDISIRKMMIHHVGNQGLGEPLTLSENHVMSLTEEEERLLTSFFIKGFQTDNYQSFTHHSNLEMNEVYRYVDQAFHTAVNFIEASQQLAKHLYSCSDHPRVKGGEFYVVSFENAVLDGEVVDAIGLFKSESKSTFLHIEPGNASFNLHIEKGIDLKRVDKACIIFNTEKEDGYRVLTHDVFSKGDEAQYWVKDFLGVEAVSSDFAMTKNYMSMCKSYVMERMPEEFEVDRTVQIELLNRSSGYFSKEEEIDTDQFAQTVLEQPELMDSFKAYKEQYSADHHIEIEDRFDTSKPAVKQQKKFFKSVLKLDKNFHIYVHGNRDLIEHGFDEERGMRYYKVFYNEER